MFTQLDAGVAALEKIRAQVKRYRQAVLQAAVTGYLLGELRDAKNWQNVLVKDVAFVGTGATPLRSKSEYYDGGTIPWITSGAVNEPYIDRAEECITELAVKETNAKVFPSGSLVVAMYGEGKTRGKVSELRLDAATNQACAVLVFKPEAQQHKKFVKLFFHYNYDNIRRLSSGGVQPNLNLSIIKDTSLCLPPFDEQERIVSDVERRFTIADQMEKSIEQSLRQSTRLRQSILQRAFCGKL